MNAEVMEEASSYASGAEAKTQSVKVPSHALSEEEELYFRFLREECGYIHPVRVNDTWWVALEQLIFHGSMIAGKIGDYVGHDYRYCYPNMNAAFLAQMEWMARGFEGEPIGWHKRRSLPARLT